MKKNLLTALFVTIFTIATFQNAFAMSFVQPYGYSVPLDLLSSNDSDVSDQCYVGVNCHTQELIGDKLAWTGANRGMSCVYVGGKAYGGTTLTQPLGRGKQRSTATVSFNKGTYFGNSELGYTNENMDATSYYYVDGDTAVKNFGFKINYATVSDDFCYASATVGSQSATGIRLDYGTEYTISLEIDVPNEKLTASIVNSYGDSVANISDTVSGLESCQNGFRFRFSNTFDVLISELSTVRDTFLTKNISLAKDETSVTASVDVAADVVYRAGYGPALPKTPLLLLGEFDAENKMTAYASDSKDAVAPEAMDAEPTYITLSATLPLSGSGDYANACLWTDIDTMLSYGPMRTLTLE